MTKLGEDLINNIEEKLSQPIENATGAGFVVSNNQDFDFKDKLKDYFSNIINLPYRSTDYALFKKISNTNYPKNNPESRPWEYLRREKETTIASRLNDIATFTKDYSVETDNVIKTEEEWKKFVNENLEGIEKERKQESDKEFEAFINECIKPKNYHELLKIIKLIESISNSNIENLKQIPDWLIAKKNQLLVISLVSEIERNTQQISRVEFFKMIDSLKNNSDDLNTLLYIIQIIEDHIINRTENTKNEDHLQEAIQPFKSFRTISQAFKHEMNKEEEYKDNLFIQSFIKQLPEAYHNPDVAIDFFAMPREDLLTQQYQHQKNKPF